MACQRNRSIELADYITSFGIDVNIGKNKARGNKGIFINRNNSFRIDINKSIKNEEELIKILVHEFAHFVHSKYDKTLQSLNFAFGNYNEEIQEELIKITVEEVPKTTAKELFNIKNSLDSEIKSMTKDLKYNYPDFKLSEPYNKLEKGLPLYAKYLLKYDRVRVFNKVYSIDKLDNLKDEQIAYIKLKSKQRSLKRVNSRISKLNRYYNQPTELFARFADVYCTNPELANKLAPNACRQFENILANGRIKELSEMYQLLQN